MRVPWNELITWLTERGGWKEAVAWGLALLGAYTYVVASGVPKLLDSPGYVTRFAEFGYSTGFMYFIGVYETIFGLALLIPRLSFYAALALTGEMVGATYSHLATGVGTPSHALRAIAFLLILAWLRRPAYALFRGGKG